MNDVRSFLLQFTSQLVWFPSLWHGGAGAVVGDDNDDSSLFLLLLLLLCFCLGGTARVAAKWNVERRMWRAFRVFVTVERSVVQNETIFVVSS